MPLSPTHGDARGSGVGHSSLWPLEASLFPLQFRWRGANLKEAFKKLQVEVRRPVPAQGPEVYMVPPMTSLFRTAEWRRRRKKTNLEKTFIVFEQCTVFTNFQITCHRNKTMLTAIHMKLKKMVSQVFWKQQSYQGDTLLWKVI